MKVLRFIFTALITLSLTIFLNIKYQDIPPLGKLLNPFSGIWANGEKESLSIDEIISHPDLKAEVDVVFDELLIPHIYAQNDNDAYFVQGYLTAYHRLWQMEMSVRATAGRISEILGEGALTFDRTQRRKGLTFGAERLLEEIKKDPESMAMLEAYTNGINAYVNSLSFKSYPVEYKLVNFEPEEWTPLKSCIMMKSMANMLSSGESDLENTNAYKMLGPELFNKLNPDYFPGVDPIIPVGTEWAFQPEPIGIPDSTYPDVTIRNTIEKPNPQNGSNSFVIGPSKTSNGKVILCNEPDLAINLPSIWYVAHLSSPTMNVMGSTVPGMPGVIIGFNDSIAWGNTNAQRDLVDWYYIEFKNDQRDEYLYDNKWLKTEKRIEEIGILGGDTFYDTVVYTHHGPVTYDETFLGNGQKVNFSMRWTSHDPSLEYKAVYKVNRAKNYDDFVEAFTYFTGPPQNYSFGSVSGDYALWIHGKYPIKWKNQGKFLLDGRKRSHEWQGFIPREQNVHVKNDPRGWVSSANQHPADSTYPYYIYDHSFEFYRNRRINERLLVMNDITTKDLMELQNDNFNYIASENLPMMLDSLDSSQLVGVKLEYAELLKSWDYFNNPENKAPSIFEMWQDFLLKNAWDEFRSDSLALRRPRTYNSFYAMQNYPDLELFDIQETDKVETLTDLINLSFVQAVDSVENWKKETGKTIEWYKFKNTRAQHLARLNPFTVSEIKIGGNHNIVNAASTTHGPSWRMVVELGDGQVKAWGVYPGSQSGNPGNPLWGHMIEDWADGEYNELFFGSKDEIKIDQVVGQVKFQN